MALTVALAIVLLGSGCSTSTEGARRLETGDSGVFASVAVSGFEVVQVSEAPPGERTVGYGTSVVDDYTWKVTSISFADGRFDDPTLLDGMGWSPTVVRGKAAYRGPCREDGRVVGEAVYWLERPGLMIEVEAHTDAGIDLMVVAEGTYEVSDAAFESLMADVGGSTPTTVPYLR